MDAETSPWPETFPDGCPPPDAYQEERVYYHFLKGPLCCSKDFLSKYLTDPNRSWTGEDRINAHGVSGYDTLEQAKSAISIPKMRKRFQAIAVGSVVKGVIKFTYGNGHITWWIYKGERPEEYFKVVHTL